MQITVTMHGNLRRFLPTGEASAAMEVPDGSSVIDVARQLHAQHDIWIAAVNGTVVTVSTPLAHGDRLECFEAIHGG
jgi:sulfur carrier protein ThiS